jgi:hypothetical protein
LNAHSVLYIGGETAGISSLQGDLAKVEGATIRLRLSKAASNERLFGGLGCLEKWTGRDDE